MFRIKFVDNAVLALLSYLVSIVGNYGLAIIITTVIVKLALLPLSIKQEKTTLCSPLTVIVAQKRTYPLTLNPEKARSKMPAFLEPASAFKEIRTE